MGDIITFQIQIDNTLSINARSEGEEERVFSKAELEAMEFLMHDFLRSLHKFGYVRFGMYKNGEIWHG